MLKGNETRGRGCQVVEAVRSTTSKQPWPVVALRKWGRTAGLEARGTWERFAAGSQERVLRAIQTDQVKEIVAQLERCEPTRRRVMTNTKFSKEWQHVGTVTKS